MNAMKQLYAAIALSPFCIFPFYADEAAGDNNIALGNEPTSRENTAQANLPEFDGWSDERLREYEDSLVNALFPTPAIVEISPDSIPKGVDKAPNINNNGLLTGYAHIPDSREIDASCVVGDIPVSSGVSQTGGRTFEILSFPTVYTDKKGTRASSRSSIIRGLQRRRQNGDTRHVRPRTFRGCGETVGMLHIRPGGKPDHVSGSFLKLKRFSSGTSIRIRKGRKTVRTNSSPWILTETARQTLCI